MKNGISNEEMEIAKSELKSIFDEEKNVFTGIVFKWREVRGKEKGETLIAGNPETKVHVTTAYAFHRNFDFEPKFCKDFLSPDITFFFLYNLLRL